MKNTNTDDEDDEDEELPDPIIYSVFPSQQYFNTNVYTRMRYLLISIKMSSILYLLVDLIQLWKE